MTTTRVTNDVFAEKVGCDFTTASRLRNGNRLPSAALLVRIRRAFDLNLEEIMAAYEGGHESFGRYMRENVFDVEHPVTDPSEPANDSEDEDETDDQEQRTA